MILGSAGEILLSESLRMGPSSLRNCMAQQDLSGLEDLWDHARSDFRSLSLVREEPVSPCAPFHTAWIRELPGALGNLEICN